MLKGVAPAVMAEVLRWYFYAGLLGIELFERAKHQVAVIHEKDELHDEHQRAIACAIDLALSAAQRDDDGDDEVSVSQGRAEWPDRYPTGEEAAAGAGAAGPMDADVDAAAESKREERMIRRQLALRQYAPPCRQDPTRPHATVSTDANAPVLAWQVH